jgi:hypothetical protein
MTEPEIVKRVEFFVNATGATVASTFLDPAVVYLPTTSSSSRRSASFRMIQRRWHVAADARILILQLEELH